MKKSLKHLSVLMNGLLVGKLIKLHSGAFQFQYDQTWLDKPDARPISLSFPLSSTCYEGDRVYYFFDNLLPDNPSIRARIQARFQLKTDQPFDLLESIGRDCVGAIQLLEEGTIQNVKRIQGQILDEVKISNLLKNYQQSPLGMTKQEDAFRISIAGAQEKLGLLYHAGKWMIPKGATPTTHILKLPIGFIHHQQLDLSDSCENEWLCMKIAEAFGLPVAASEVECFNDTKVLVVKRFDRKLSSDKQWIMRLPQEDMCQALGVSPHLKYQADGGPGIREVMNLLLGSVNAEQDRQLFFKSQLLFILLAAIDGHAKNFSIFIEPGGKYRLTPLYDIISVYPMLRKKQLQEKKIKMAMALLGKTNHYRWCDAQRRYVISTAKAARYSVINAEQCLDEMLVQINDVISCVSKQLSRDFPSHISDPIFEGMLRMRQAF